jgi:hypothetical protein
VNQREPTPSVLPYEPSEEKRTRIWNAGNVSLLLGTALLLSIWIGVPTLSLGPARVRELLEHLGVPLFAVWVLGPAVGATIGIVGIVRRVGGSATLGVVVNVLCWPVLVLVCWVCLIRGR